MTAFADSSALVKLYVDEEGHEPVRRLAPMVICELARVEVPAAFWRKHRMGDIDAADAGILAAAFEADYFGTADNDPRFVVVATGAGVLDDAARLCRRHPLRAYDAIQLASALAAQDADPRVGTMAVFDAGLRGAAAAEGLAVVPPAPGRPAVATVVPPPLR